MIRATNQMSVRVRGEEDGSVAPGAALCSAALRRDAKVSPPLVPPLAEEADDRGAPRL